MGSQVIHGHNNGVPFPSKHCGPKGSCNSVLSAAHVRIWCTRIALLTLTPTLVALRPLLLTIVIVVIIIIILIIIIIIIIIVVIIILLLSWVAPSAGWPAGGNTRAYMRIPPPRLPAAACRRESLVHSSSISVHISIVVSER